MPVNGAGACIRPYTNDVKTPQSCSTRLLKIGYEFECFADVARNESDSATHGKCDGIFPCCECVDLR